MLISFILFFQFCLRTMEAMQLMCGNHKVRSMTNVIQYRAYKPNANGEFLEKRVNTAKVPIISTENGMVYAGYIRMAEEEDKKTNNDDGDGSTIKCVAVKIINELDEFENARNVSDQIQTLLPQEGRRHIIEMIDAGVRRLGGGDSGINNSSSAAPLSQQGILIMELGAFTYADMIYDGVRFTFQNDDDLAQMIRDIVVPVQEFHQVAIHLDVKPNNFVLVQNEIERKEFLLGTKKSSASFWKLIDFSGAQLIADTSALDSVVDSKDQQTLGANGPVWPNIRIQSAMYNSPEAFTSKILSQKTDIWSIGIIILELILLHNFYSEYSTLAKPTKDVILMNLNNVIDVYRGFSLKMNNTTNEFEKKSPIKYFSNKKWLLHYFDSIVFILQFWTEFPQMAMLITNLLSSNRKVRMTASGILEFINGRCVPSEIKNAQTVQQLTMFNHVSLGEFETILGGWVVANKDQQVAEDELEKQEKLAKLMTTATKRQANVMQKLLKKCRKVCDTGI